MHRWLGGLAPAAAGLACAGLMLGAAGALAQDDPPGRVGRLAAIQGETFVYDDELGEWQAAQHNRPLTQGDRLSTAADARVELRIGSTTLHLGGSAELDVVRLDDERLQFALLRGSLGLRVRSSEVAVELEVLTPEGRFVPLRSGLYRIDRQDEISYASVWRGELQFQASDLSRHVQPGQRAEFWREGPQRIARSQWLAPLDDAFAQAVLRDDQADTRSAATVFVSPEMTGVEDLDRHGGWQQHPEYGAVWTPATVVVGWVPYRHGQWVWLRPWGWTWVDDARWGFAPFHYGRWLSWGGRWCWAPGPRVARPVYAPALVAWAAGPQFNVQVGSRPVPAVGWVPLAPREHYRPGYRASQGYLNRLNAHAQLLGPPGAGYGNRHVPGAVTVLPTERLAPRQPVAAAALRADQMALARQWQAERFHFDAPGRPAYPPRESTRPRASRPAGAMPGNAAAVAAIPGEPPVPRPSAAERPSRQVPQPREQGLPAVQTPAPFFGRSSGHLARSATQPVAPPAQLQPQAADAAPLAQAAVAPAVPQAAAAPPMPQAAAQASPEAMTTRAARERGGSPGAAGVMATPRPAVPATAPAVSVQAAVAATPGVPAPAVAAAPKPLSVPTAVARNPPVAAAPVAATMPGAPAAPRPATVPPPRTEAKGAPGRDDDPQARRRTPESRQMQREK